MCDSTEIVLCQAPTDVWDPFLPVQWTVVAGGIAVVILCESSIQEEAMVDAEAAAAVENLDPEPHIRIDTAGQHT